MKTLIDGKFISVNDAAAALGCTVGRVRQLLLSGVIAGEKLTERAWAVSKESLDKHKKQPRVTGRPRVSPKIKKNK